MTLNQMLTLKWGDTVRIMTAVDSPTTGVVERIMKVDPQYHSYTPYKFWVRLRVDGWTGLYFAHDIEPLEEDNDN